MEREKAWVHVWLKTKNKLLFGVEKNVQTYFMKPQFISEYFYLCFVHTTDSCVYKTGLSRFNLTPPNEKVIFSNTDFQAANIWSTQSCLHRYKCCQCSLWPEALQQGHETRLQKTSQRPWANLSAFTCQHLISKKDKKAFPSCCKVAVRITIWSAKHSKCMAMRSMQTYWRQQRVFGSDFSLILIHTLEQSRESNWGHPLPLRLVGTATLKTHHWGRVWFAKMTANSKKKDGSLEIQVYQCTGRCGQAACDCTQQQLHSAGHCPGEIC